MQEGTPPLETVSLVQTAVRLLVAGGLGALIGVERERRERPAGLRTCTLIAVAACLLTILSIEISALLARDDRVVMDPLRVIEAVTAGVAFLGAGTIVATKGHVRGVTTATGMWAAGAFGVAAGAGFFGAAVIACVIALFILSAMRRLDRWIVGSAGVEGSLHFNVPFMFSLCYGVGHDQICSDPPLRHA